MGAVFVGRRHCPMSSCCSRVMSRSSKVVAAPPTPVTEKFILPDQSASTAAVAPPVVQALAGAPEPIASVDASASRQQTGTISFSPPMHSDGGASSQSSKRTQSPGGVDSSPKRITMVRNTVCVSINEWLQRCPDPSASGTGGTGNSYVVVIEQLPTAIVITKKDNRKVSKKTITLGDDSGRSVDLTIWGNFAARSWMYPEGSILLIKNLKFSGYYKGQLQLAFADADPCHELLITKADESLEVTKKLKKWSV
jgi:hypothetical protein